MRMHHLHLKNPAGVGIGVLLPRPLTFAPSATATREGEAKNFNAELQPQRPGLLARIDDWFWRQRLREVEAYLAESADVYEVEARMRALERRVPYPYY